MKFIKSSLVDRRTSLLNNISKYKILLLWIALYMLFSIFGLQHATLAYSCIWALASVIPMILLSATVQYALIPTFLRARRLWAYYSLSLLLICLFCYLFTQADHLLLKYLYDKGLEIPDRIREDLLQNEDKRVFSTLKYTFLLTSTFAITNISYLLNERQRIEVKTKEEKLNLELRYLRSQINPHFLFNALNNIYSLAYLKDDKALECILKLSEMFRYVTDGCQADLVPLNEEINYIDNFIVFMRISMEHEADSDIRFKKTITNPSFLIPPMLLQPMVENCFKHSRIDKNPNGFIHLTLIQKDNKLRFITENSLALPSTSTFPIGNNNKTDKNNLKDERIGVGLKNVKQRLELLYGKKYSLTIERKVNTFYVELELNSTPQTIHPNNPQCQ